MPCTRKRVMTLFRQDSMDVIEELAQLNDTSLSKVVSALVDKSLIDMGLVTSHPFVASVLKGGEGG